MNKSNKMSCGYCGQKIDMDEGYYHEEITDWRNSTCGVSEEFWYHRLCYRSKMEILHNV